MKEPILRLKHKTNNSMVVLDGSDEKRSGSLECALKSLNWGSLEGLDSWELEIGLGVDSAVLSEKIFIVNDTGLDDLN